MYIHTFKCSISNSAPSWYFFTSSTANPVYRWTAHSITYVHTYMYTYEHAYVFPQENTASERGTHKYNLWLAIDFPIIDSMHVPMYIHGCHALLYKREHYKCWIVYTSENSLVFNMKICTLNSLQVGPANVSNTIVSTCIYQIFVDEWAPHPHSGSKNDVLRAYYSMMAVVTGAWAWLHEQGTAASTLAPLCTSYTRIEYT